MPSLRYVHLGGEKVSYEITGECKKCGKCCNYMYSYDTYTEKEFKIMHTHIHAFMSLFRKVFVNPNLDD